MEKEKGLPEDWRERIRGRKVIFYNTSIANLLNGGEKHICKIAYVLETFRAHKEVVLWWRPHPLELSTVEAMRPDLATKYKALRRQYAEEGWGILDTSADVNRAIAISDAYYGDWSSVVNLYYYTNKPILMAQDSVIENVEEAMNVTDFVSVGNDIWFVSYWNNYLFRISNSSMREEKMIKLPIGVSGSKYLIRHLLKVDDELILVPNNEKCILRFDLEKETFYIEQLNSNILANFSSILFVGGGIILGVNGNDNCVYEYNINTKTYSTKIIGDKDNHYSALCQINENDIALMTYTYTQKKIIIWNVKNENVIEIKGFPENEESINQSYPFTDMVSINQIIYLFPRYSNMVIAINVDKEEISQVKINYKEFNYDRGYIFANIKLYMQDILAYSQYTGEWLLFKAQSGEICNACYSFTDEQRKLLKNINILDDYVINNKCFFEQENKDSISLDRFLKSLSKIDYKDFTNQTNINIGKKIYEKLSYGGK